MKGKRRSISEAGAIGIRGTNLIGYLFKTIEAAYVKERGSKIH